MIAVSPLLKISITFQRNLHWSEDEGKIITLKVLHAFQFSTFLCHGKEDYEMRKKNLLIINLEKAAKEFEVEKGKI